jgi:hypothetical protein
MIKMLIFSFSLVFVLFSFGQSQKLQHLQQNNITYQSSSNAPSKFQNIVSKCYDLSYSGLGEKAKEMLIDAIYDPTYINDEAYIRFALGQICMDLKEEEGAKYQWNIVYSRYPGSEEAAQIKIFFKVLNWVFEGWVSDSKFSKEYEMSSLFWNKKDPEPGMNPTDLIDPIMALKYLQEIYQRYPDEDKRATILYDQFLLFMGYNTNNFGYEQVNESSGDFDNNPSLKYYKEIMIAQGDTSILKVKPNINIIKRSIYTEYSDDDSDEDYDFKAIRIKAKRYFLSQAIAISDNFKALSIGNSFYIRTQFLIGVSLSGSKPYSSKLKMTPEARPYFENVVGATEGEETNLYRLFALKWLSETK